MKPLFVQIKCRLGEAYRVAERICDDLEETSELYSISGHYDLLVKFHLDEGQRVGEFVNYKLHKIEGIQETNTIIAFRLFGAAEATEIDETDFRSRIPKT